MRNTHLLQNEAKNADSDNISVNNSKKKQADKSKIDVNKVSKIPPRNIFSLLDSIPNLWFICPKR